MEIKRAHAVRANAVDLAATDIGNLPSSFLRKSPWYTGTLRRTKTPQSRTCNAIVSKTLRPPSLMNTCFKSMPRRQNKLSNASVASKVSIGDEFPNSMISFSYRWETSSSATFADTTKVDSEKPKNLKMVSTKAKR